MSTKDIMQLLTCLGSNNIHKHTAAWYLSDDLTDLDTIYIFSVVKLLSQ